MARSCKSSCSDSLPLSNQYHCEDQHPYYSPAPLFGLHGDPHACPSLFALERHGMAIFLKLAHLTEPSRHWTPQCILEPSQASIRLCIFFSASPDHALINIIPTNTWPARATAQRPRLLTQHPDNSYLPKPSPACADAPPPPLLANGEAVNRAPSAQPAATTSADARGVLAFLDLSGRVYRIIPARRRTSA
jgi:hypothetical protein